VTLRIPEEIYRCAGGICYHSSRSSTLLWNQTRRCEIWGRYSDVPEDVCPLKCDPVSLGEQFLTFVFGLRGPEGEGTNALW